MSVNFEMKQLSTVSLLIKLCSFFVFYRDLISIKPLNLLKICLDSPLINYIAQEFFRGHIKYAFKVINPHLIYPHNLESDSEALCVIPILEALYHHIIYIDLRGLANEVDEHLINQSLVGGLGIFQF